MFYRQEDESDEGLTGGSLTRKRRRQAVDLFNSTNDLHRRQLLFCSPWSEGAEAGHAFYPALRTQIQKALVAFTANNEEVDVIAEAIAFHMNRPLTPQERKELQEMVMSRDFWCVLYTGAD